MNDSHGGAGDGHPLSANTTGGKADPRMGAAHTSAAYSQRFRELLGKLPTAPKFDRIAVRDLAIFRHVPRKDPNPSLGYPALALLGFPVFVDEEVEPGVIELRKGEEVVERVYL